MGQHFSVSALENRSFEIGGLACSSVSVTTPEVTWGTHVVSPFDHRALRLFEDRRKRLRYRGECFLDFTV